MTSRLTSAIVSGSGANIRTMIPIATPMLTAAWIPSSRCSRARIRSVSSSSESTAAVPEAAPGACASAASRDPGRTS